MRLFYLLLWVLVFFAPNLLGQSNSTKVFFEGDNSEELILLADLYHNREGNPERSYEIASQMLNNLTEESPLKLKIASYLVKSVYSKILNKGGRTPNLILRAHLLLTPELKQTHFGALVMSNCAHYFASTKQFDLALKVTNESNNTLEHLDLIDSKLLYLNYTNIATTYTQIKKYDNAYNAYLKALPHAKIFSSLSYSSCHNNIGLLYYEQGKFDTALQYYHKSKKILDTNLLEHKIFDMNVDENIANIFAKTNRLLQALKIFQQVSATRRLTKNRLDSLEALRSDVYQLEILSRLNRNSEFKKIVEFIDQFYAENEQVVQDYTNRTVENYYLAKLYHYQRIKDNLNYMINAPIYIDYKAKKIDYQKQQVEDVKNNYIQLQHRDFEKKIELEKKLYHEEKRSGTRWVYFLISIILLFGAIIATLLLLNKLRKSAQNKIKLNTKITELENEKLAKHLETQQRDIINVIADGEMRTNFQKSLLTKIETIISDKDQSVKKLFKPITMEIKSQINLSHRLSVLKSDISRANANFDKSLLELCPNLSKTEREICSFIRLNLSVKEIAQIRGVTTGSVKMLRSRIRKKLELDRNSELDGYIQSV